jgi:hypothetical protein
MLYGDLPTVHLDTEDVAAVVVRVPNPPKTAFLRLPTNQEMLERLDQQKSLRRNIGRRKSQTNRRIDWSARRNGNSGV